MMLLARPPLKSPPRSSDGITVRDPTQCIMSPTRISWDTVAYHFKFILPSTEINSPISH